MGSVRSRLYPNSERVYYIDYVDAAGARIREAIGAGKDSRKLAGQILARREAEVRLGKHGVPPSQTPRFAEFSREWVRRKTPYLKPKTLESYEDALAHRVVPCFGEKRLGAITRRDVEDFVTDLTARGTRKSRYGKTRQLATRTINKTLTVLGMVLKDALSLKVITENPAVGIKPLPVPRSEDDTARHLEPAQLDKLLAVAESPWQALWRLMGRVGLRRGEALGVMWSDIDFEKGLLLVRRSIQRIPRKDGRGYEVRVTDLKTKASYRTVPLFLDVLEALRTLQVEAVVSGRTPDEQRVFPFDPDNVDRAYKRALKLAGLPGFYRVHDLRHTAASIMLAANVPMKTVQAILGHSSFRVTADTYGHLLSSSLEGVGEQVQAFLQGTNKAQETKAGLATSPNPAS